MKGSGRKTVNSQMFEKQQILELNHGQFNYRTRFQAANDGGAGGAGGAGGNTPNMQEVVLTDKPIQDRNLSEAGCSC